MIVGMLWIIGVYGLAAAAVYTGYVLRRRQGGKPALLIVCVSCNHEQQIEWYIRMFLLLSAVRGRAIDLRVLDEGSTDDTLRIVEKAARFRDNISLLHTYEELNRELAGRETDAYRIYVLGGESNRLGIPVFP